jgi:hypothetical protein
VKVGTILIFDEGTEWGFTTNAGARVTISPGNPHTGVNAINGSNCTNGDNATLTAPSSLVITNFNNLQFWLEPVGAGLSNALSGMTVVWLDPMGAFLASISAKAAAYGFNPANFSYQLLTVPIADFGLPAGTLVGALQFNFLPKTTYSFWLDTISIQ